MKELTQIIWNEEKEAFIRKDTSKEVKTIVPIGPLQRYEQCDPHGGPDSKYLEPSKYDIEAAAEKFRKFRPNAYEHIVAARDVSYISEFEPPKDAHIFRLYRIS